MIFLKFFLSFPLIILHEFYRYFIEIYYRSYFYSKNIKISNRVKLLFSFKDVEIGSGTYIGTGTILIVNSLNNNTQRGSLYLGENVGINEYCNIRASGGSIKIGSNTLLAQFVTIVASNHNIKANELILLQGWSEERNSIVVGADVWIGAGAIILPGAVIEDGAIVGAGSVVNSQIFKNEIWAGVPAKKIGCRK